MFFSRKVDKMVVLCADEEGNGSFVEAAPLSVPFLDGIKGALSGQVEHEQYGNSIIAHQW